MFESQEPDRRAEHLRWTTLKLFPGKKIRGWKAGPGLCVKTHHAGVSKPCKIKLTKGVLPCNYCEGKIRFGFTGYMPFISEEGDKLVVIYGADYDGRVQEIPYGSPIVIRKANCKNGVVSVTRNDWSTLPCSWLAKRKTQHNIKPWLLQLWKETDLQEFFGMVNSDIPVIQNDDDISPQLRNRLQQQPLISDLLKDREVKSTESLPVPSTNGHHKVPKNGKK